MDEVFWLLVGMVLGVGLFLLDFWVRDVLATRRNAKIRNQQARERGGYYE